MNSDNLTDEFFQQQLEHYSSPVPADMWNRILAKKKRRMLLLFLRLSGFSVLIVGTAAALFFFSGGQPAPLAISSKKTETVFMNSDTNKTARADLFSKEDPARAKTSSDDRNQMHPILTAPGSYPEIANHGQLEADFSNRRGSEEVKTKDRISVPVDSNNDAGSKSIKAEDSSGEASIHINSTKKSQAGKEQDSLENAEPEKTEGEKAAPVKEVKKPEIHKHSDERKWFLDLYVSPDYAIVASNENIKAKFSYSLGVKINRSFGKHLSVKTGIQFSRINTGADSLSSVLKLQLFRLDVPILAGYSFGDQSFKTTFNAGALINLFTWTNTGTDYFRKNTGLSAYLGMNLERKIDKKLSVFCEPYYRYQVTPMTANAAGDLKFIHVAGINIGGRYFFK